jgi:hypothetical protein
MKFLNALCKNGMCCLNVESMVSHKIPETAQSKTWVCDRSLVGIGGSNPPGHGRFSYECFVLCLRPIIRTVGPKPVRS